jgi:ferredoxin
MKVRVDSRLCQGHGQCVFLCPQVFAADEQGFATVTREEIPPDAENDVAKAAACCPEGAIQIGA